MDFEECIQFNHFLIDWIFKCVETSLTEQTSGPETLSNVGVWTNKS